MRRYTSSGADRAWSWGTRPQDATVRRHVHGPIQGMDEINPRRELAGGMLALTLLAIAAVGWLVVLA